MPAGQGGNPTDGPNMQLASDVWERRLSGERPADIARELGIAISTVRRGVDDGQRRGRARDAAHDEHGQG